MLRNLWHGSRYGKLVGVAWLLSTSVPEENLLYPVKEKLSGR